MRRRTENSVSKARTPRNDIKKGQFAVEPTELTTEGSAEVKEDRVTVVDNVVVRFCSFLAIRVTLILPAAVSIVLKSSVNSPKGGTSSKALETLLISSSMDFVLLLV